MTKWSPFIRDSEGGGERETRGVLGTIWEYVPIWENNMGILFLDCIDVNILVVLLHYPFTIGYHWEKLSKGHTWTSVLFLIHMNLQLS